MSVKKRNVLQSCTIGQDFDKILGSNENKTAGNGIAEAEISNSSTRSAALQPRIDASLPCQPLSAFKMLVRVQKANGIQLITGYDTSSKAREFLRYLPSAVIEKIVALASTATAFVVLCDGSQAHKIGSKKELVLKKEYMVTLPCVAKHR